MGSVYAVAKSRRTSRRTNASDTLTAGSVQVLGESVYYRASGSPEEGPTILCLHESGGASATWQAQLQGLAGGARCLVPDLPGHGQSEGRGHVEISDYRRAVLAFLDALAIRWPVVIAGVCLGAAIAVDLALHAPERVTGLVLAGIIEGGRAGSDCRSAAGQGEATEEFVAGLFGSGASRQMLNERFQRWRLTSPLVRFGDLDALHRYPLVRMLRLVTHPVLLVAGAEDPIATPAATAALAAETAGARVTTVPGAGCLSMLEQPASFNPAVAGFLDGLRLALPIEPGTPLQGGYRRF
jgi:3-oxoadipate enol-lactonase